MLTAKQAFNLASRLVAAGHDVDGLRRPNGMDWQVSVKLPSNDFWLIEEPIARVSPPEEEI